MDSSATSSRPSSQDDLVRRVIEIWQGVNPRDGNGIETRLREFGNLYLSAGSGAKGNMPRLKQMAGMPGPDGQTRKGKILPCHSLHFREGLSVLEYFISTHGARKGLVTGLRTADPATSHGRIIEVAQDVNRK